MRVANAVTGCWKGAWDEAGVAHWAAGLRSRLAAPTVTLGQVYLSPDHFEHAAEVLEVLRLHARIPLLVGCSGSGLVCDGEERQGEPGIVLALHHLPGARLKASHLTPANLEELSDPADLRKELGVSDSPPNAWLILGSPSGLPGEAWVRRWNAAFPGVPALGGLASGTASPLAVQLYLDGEVHEEGLVALAVGGDVTIEPLVSQGCMPIGQSWLITRSDRNFILGLGNRPAYSVLVDTFNGLTPEEQARSQNNLFIGLANNEYHEEFQAGDFLIRNLLGADPGSGVLAVGAYPRTGQTLQFHRRDAAAAGQELGRLLEGLRERLRGRTVHGGLMCLCLGRGARMFGRPDPDAALVQEQLGPLPMAGFFGNGEIGPVGDANFLHGYTAVLGLFVSRYADPS